MAKRVTIMIDLDLDRKIRIKQAELIKKTTATVSFSSVVNLILRGKAKL